MKMYVHNRMEAGVLLKEMNERGEYHDSIDFYSHGGEFIGQAVWSHKLQELIFVF